MRTVFFILLAMNASVANASSVESLSVKNGIVTFVQTLPSVKQVQARASCSQGEKPLHWSFPLNSIKGKGMFSALMFASTHQLPISIVGAQSCNEYSDIESVAELTVLND
ncbi:hypothetical protein OE749_06425 [Aestuariibacter sp. AA17]|uniref:Uncharacterized protein n=1 Tax=Fluctibacter corallii TaxID=2984329 RepID=A0ABT3A6L3_9ALTE|nr:hypothetical protein [Aestuariibacter sp. AA17]MCV2884325.1 hypothetical protein [Aestuariibacter sp. AA17]